MSAERAISLDLDGVVIQRPPFQLKALIDRHIKRRGARIFTPPAEIPTPNRDPQPGQIKPQELISFLMHSRRSLRPGVEAFLDSQYGTDIFANTGRPTRIPWITMTLRTLIREGVNHRFNDFFFKPDGTRTMISKLAAIAELRQTHAQVTHYDDNPADALPIAAFFPDVQVVIVQDLTTGLLYSRSEAQRYPNVTRVASLNGSVK